MSTHEGSDRIQIAREALERALEAESWPQSLSAVHDALAPLAAEGGHTTQIADKLARRMGGRYTPDVGPNPSPPRPEGEEREEPKVVEIAQRILDRDYPGSEVALEAKIVCAAYLTRTTPSVDPVGAAEQQVGQWVYLRIEALMDAKPGTPEADELQYLAALAEEVEEYGISEVSGKDRPIAAAAQAPRRPARVELIKAHRVAFGSNLPTAKLAVDEGWRPSPDEMPAKLALDPILGEVVKAAQAVVDATGQTLSGQWVINGDGEVLICDLHTALNRLGGRGG